MFAQNNLNLPDQLKPYEKAIADTIKPYLRISTTPNITQWWQSKFGGLPYLPKTVNYPTNEKGDYLTFLAQINFAEIPNLEDFPTQGILQFYIDGNDDLSGLDYDNPTNQDAFRVTYFNNIESSINNLVTDFDFLPSCEFSPIKGEFALDFVLASSPITPYEAPFEQLFPNFNDDNLLDVYDQWFTQQFWLKLEQNQQHKLGGYPDFVQEDPRFNPDYQDYILLLQIASQNYNSVENDISWGDGGFGNFFIKPDHLKALDFSNVLYNWDN
ncbi:MAG: YwqG family protein [Microcystaceae cyanobacterium]